mgnify:CR=1 FL=1
MIILSLVSSIFPVEEFHKPFYVHAKNSFFQYQLLKAAKKRNERLGFISTLHTFGRDMKHNPHIHSLVAECTIDNTGKRKPYNYFNYESLRKSFMKQVLKRMYDFLKDNGSNKDLEKFKKIRKWLYEVSDNGFYVHAPKTELKILNKLNVLLIMFVDMLVILQ